MPKLRPLFNANPESEEILRKLAEGLGNASVPGGGMQPEVVGTEQDPMVDPFDIRGRRKRPGDEYGNS